MTHRVTGVKTIIDANKFKKEWETGETFILNGISEYGNQEYSNGYCNKKDIWLKESTRVVTNEGIKTFGELGIH